MWHEVCDTDELDEEDATTVYVDGEDVAVFRLGDGFYAISDICTHAGASLFDGGVRDGTVRCPRHGAPFDVRTGDALGYPAPEGVPTYETKVEEATVYVNV